MTTLLNESEEPLYYPAGKPAESTRYEVTTQRVQRDNWTFWGKTPEEVQEKRQAIIDDQEAVYPGSSVCFVDPESIDLGSLQASVYGAIDLMREVVESDGQRVALQQANLQHKMVLQLLKGTA